VLSCEKISSFTDEGISERRSSAANSAQRRQTAGALVIAPPSRRQPQFVLHHCVKVTVDPLGVGRAKQLNGIGS